MSDQGKGDGRRPMVVDPDTFASNWERTFGKGKKSPKTDGKSGGTAEIPVPGS